jgi:hypothetical protein
VSAVVVIIEDLLSCVLVCLSSVSSQSICKRLLM